MAEFKWRLRQSDSRVYDVISYVVLIPSSTVEEDLEQKYLVCLTPKQYFQFPQKKIFMWEVLGSMQAIVRVCAQCIKPERDISGIFHTHFLR